ncbi:DUF4336 domain-containing protein [Noviherbaspirillum denitrificans]|uniref:DUF4336 domain-containing protein n=1 Tax=Noviherbaspirillum denitrificans TaxID=1968433 RepID=A0A254TA25_9BURK|nr:DUF4336 domain-containing protein [Noviherbaspirillum denitrificans]OWW19484.1 hypothetical protein AYR66_08130 [Noviherbaspirillum denitrificans]
MSALKAIASNIWYRSHHFVASGIPVSSRMTVIRLKDGRLWLHSPVPLSVSERKELESLGQVGYIVAPNRMHHLFLAEYASAYPDALLFGAPGLRAKRPDLTRLSELGPTVEASWKDDLEQVFFDGIPIGNETVWFHIASRTLILTDLCQWWQGELPFAAKAYAHVTGVRRQLAVPRTIRLMVRDRHAARASAQEILQWPFERVVMAHNAIVEDGAYPEVKRAFTVFGC